MSNMSSLFENLMTYNDAGDTNDNKKRGSQRPVRKNNKQTVNENDQTLLNLTVELPTDTEDISPEDVKVNVGVMNVDTDDENNNEDAEDVNVDTDDETAADDEIDIDIDDENTDDNDKKDKNDEDDDSSKEESLKLRKEETDVEKAKANIRKRVAAKESLMHLDTTSLNKLITTFVKDNYKNIDKVVITKAILENNKLILNGKIKDKSGKVENISLINRGFDAKKLESTRFLIDFKDKSNTFNVMKEGLKQPFVFTATMQKGVVKFESLKCNFKTRLDESKIAHVTGTYALKESIKR